VRSRVFFPPQGTSQPFQTYLRFPPQGLPSAIGPGPVFDTTANNHNNTVSSITVAHVLGGQANRMVIVAVIQRSIPLRTATATYNGQAITQIFTADNGTNKRIIIFSLLENNLPSPGTHNVIVTYSANVGDAVVGVTSWSNANQANPSNTATAQSAGSGTAAVNITTTANNSMVLDAVLVTGNNVLTQDGSQTLDWQQNDTGGGLNVSTGASHKLQALAGSVTMQWTFTSNAWLHAAVEIKSF
jgi:hypothetical protein